MPNRIASGVGSMSITLHRTDTPSGRSTTPTTYGTGTPGNDWCPPQDPHSVPRRDSAPSANRPRPPHLLHAIRRPRYVAPHAAQRCPTRYGSRPPSGGGRKGKIRRGPRTGGGGGTGAGLAGASARRAARLVLADVDPEALERTAAALSAGGTE